MSKSPTIESYKFGHIVIDGESYNEDVINLPEGVEPHWWRDKGHVLQPQDLDKVIEAKPEAVVVGQGAHGRMRITAEARERLEGANIEVIAAPTEEACETYSEIRESRYAAAALHLTC